MGLKTITVFLYIEMEGKVISNGKNCMSKSQSRKARGYTREMEAI